MSDQGRWFKLWVTADDDPALSCLSLEDFSRWCLFGVYLKKHGTDGSVVLHPPCPVLQQRFRVLDFAGVLGVISRFPNCTVTGETNVTVTWRNWLKFQGDFSGDRVTRFRQRVTAKKRREEKRRDETRRESKDVGTEPAPTLAVPLPANLQGWLLDTRNLKPLADNGSGTWWVTLEKAYDQYPWLFFEDEIRKADAWLESNPARRPTPKGLKRFMRSWFERAVEMGRRHHAEGTRPSSR